MTQQAQSTAPLVCLLRILQRCWKERQLLSDDVVERIREQLEGPLGVKAKADERLLEAMEAFSLGDLTQLGGLATATTGGPFDIERIARQLEVVVDAELARRGVTR